MEESKQTGWSRSAVVAGYYIAIAIFLFISFLTAEVNERSNVAVFLCITIPAVIGSYAVLKRKSWGWWVLFILTIINGFTSIILLRRFGVMSFFWCMTLLTDYPSRWPRQNPTADVSQPTDVPEVEVTANSVIHETNSPSRMNTAIPFIVVCGIVLGIPSLRSFLYQLPKFSAEKSVEHRDTWMSYNNSRGRFKTFFPGPVTAKEQPMKNKAFGEIVLHSYIHETEDIAYMVCYCDYPNKFIDQRSEDVILEDACKGTVSKVKATLADEVTVTHQGYPGREITFYCKNIYFKSRILLVNNRMYIVTVGAASEGRCTSDDAQRFMKSFSLH